MAVIARLAAPGLVLLAVGLAADSAAFGSAPATTIQPPTTARPVPNTLTLI